MQEPIKKNRAFKGKGNRLIIFVLGFLLMFSLGTYALASFFPGETNDPSCAPGTSGCVVDIFPDQTGNGGDVLQTDGTNVSWVPAAGVTTLSAIGGAPSADGASISGTTLTLQPADGTHGGVLTSGTQTIGGAKTFSSDLTINGITAGIGAGSGGNNTVFGNGAGSVDTGGANTWFGSSAGYDNTSGSENTSIGSFSGEFNTVGIRNTGVGYGALENNTNGNYNAAFGTNAGSNLNGGSYNLVLGSTAGHSGVTTGSSNIVLAVNNNFSGPGSNFGGDNLTTGNYNVYIGGAVGSNTSNTVSISDGQGNVVFYAPSSHNVILGGGTTDSGGLLQLTATTSGEIGISPNATTASYNLILPAAQGAMDSVLENDGSGNLSWGSNVVTTLSAIGGTPNADGASISSTTLTLQPADGTHGGVLTSGTQTIGGAKTFASNITISSGGDAITAGTPGTGSSTNSTIFGGDVGAAFTTGDEDTFFGKATGSANTSGGENTGVGFLALVSNTTGGFDTAIGTNAMEYLQDGNDNTSLGVNAGADITHGSYNLMLGANGGHVSVTTGSSNIVLETSNGTNFGADNLTTGSDNVYIGGFAGTNTSNTISLSDGQGNIILYSPSSHNVIIPSAGTTSAPSDNGALFQVGGSLTASGAVTLSGITPGVACNGTSALGYNSSGVLTCDPSVSDERLKTNITPLDTTTGLAAIEELDPVSYNWKDPTLPGTGSTAEQFGFIAQQVQGVLPNLVTENAPTYLTPDVTYGLNYQGLTAVAIQAIKELDVKVTALQSIDPTVNNSLASLIVQFLENATVQIKDLTVGTLHINGNVCVDDVCVTKAQFKQMLLNAGSTQGSTSGGSGTTGSTGDTSSDGTTIGTDATTGTTTDTGTTTGDSGTTDSGGTTSGTATPDDTTTGTTGGTGTTVSGGDATGTGTSGTTTGDDSSGTGSTGSDTLGTTTGGQ